VIVGLIYPFFEGIVWNQQFGVQAWIKALTGEEFHDFAGSELHDGAWWDLHLVLWFLGIAADTGFGEADIENTEIAEFDIAARGESFDDSVERVLDHAEDFLLG
jgi:ammonia channel protein AmtB